MNRQMWWVVFVVFGLTFYADAQVRVTKSAGQKSTIDLSGFTAEQGDATQVFLRTLQGNLDRSGWFIRGAPGRSEITVSGECEGGGGNLKVACRVHEVATRSRLLSKSYRAPSTDARRLAHQVADEIIQAVTGQPGIFSGRLVLVGNRTGNKELYLCDSDGQNLIQITRDRSISIAPRWTADGETISYTSYYQGFPDVYTVEIASGRRNRIAGFPGLNTGGEISPNGRDMALILSKDGNPDVYVMDLRTRRLTRITQTLRAAEASPSWSPDGSQIVYVSDLPGSPQLYVVSRDGGPAKRLTGRVAESVAPHWGPGGLIVYSARIGGRYQVCVINPQTLENRQITADGADYEDPCWAPNGRHIVCSRTAGGRSSIYLLDTMGDPPIALLEIQGNWYSPSWSPK